MIKWIIVLAFLGIIALCTWRGYKSGIVRSVFAILAIVISIYGASLIAGIYNEEFDGMIKPFLSGMVDTAASKVRSGEDTVVKLEDGDRENVYKMSYAVMRELGLVDSAADKIAIEVEEETKNVNQDMYNLISDKVCVCRGVLHMFYPHCNYFCGGRQPCKSLLRDTKGRNCRADCRRCSWPCKRAYTCIRNSDDIQVYRNIPERKCDGQFWHTPCHFQCKPNSGDNRHVDFYPRIYS